ncbi:MAG: lactonase family protein, partial [Cyclobacteriaceae bacterium]|nr:lactonase family protein [Cyclobacteriaceae bacterium]
ANYDLPGGAGPRHLDFHQSLNVAYIINELNSTITVVNINDNGGFDSLQTVSTLPEGFEGTSYPADIHIHPNGKYLYGSNRGHDSIVSYEVDQKTGQLSVIGFADQDIDWPRNFAITPAGDFLLVANQKGSSIVSYKIDVATGKLNHTGNVLSVGQPVCILYLE